MCVCFTRDGSRQSTRISAPGERRASSAQQIKADAASHGDRRGSCGAAASDDRLADSRKLQNRSSCMRAPAALTSNGFAMTAKEASE